MRRLPGVGGLHGLSGARSIHWPGPRLGGADRRAELPHLRHGRGREVQEGFQIWEALMSGAHLRADNLTLIVDHNPASSPHPGAGAGLPALGGEAARLPLAWKRSMARHAGPSWPPGERAPGQGPAAGHRCPHREGQGCLVRRGLDVPWTGNHHQTTYRKPLPSYETRRCPRIPGRQESGEWLPRLRGSSLPGKKVTRRLRRGPTGASYKTNDRLVVADGDVSTLPARSGSPPTTRSASSTSGLPRATWSAWPVWRRRQDPGGGQLTRFLLCNAYDQLRHGAFPQLNVKAVGAMPVSPSARMAPSQMAIEDIALGLRPARFAVSPRRMRYHARRRAGTC